MGVGINATLSANLTRYTYQRAEEVYRLRFLSDKYGLDPRRWIDEATSDGDDFEGELLELPDVAEMLDDEIGAAD